MATAVHAAIDEVAAEMHAGLPKEVEVTEPSTDNLIFRFWQLSNSQMRDIALELDLITKNDLQLPPHERYHMALNVAKEKGLLVELARRIEKHEKNV